MNTLIDIDLSQETHQPCPDCMHAEHVSATELERQFQESRTGQIQARRQLLARIKATMNDLQIATRRPMAYDQYAAIAVAIVTLSQAADEIEVMA